MFITKVNGENIKKRKLTIRKCRIKDVDMLIKFQDDVMENIENKKTWGGYEYDDIVKLINNDEYIELYYDNDVFVGFIILIVKDHKYKLNDVDNGEVGVCGGVMVAPAYWGNGLQKQMSKRLEKKAIEKGCKYIIATVSPDNVYSYNNLMSLGYEIVGEKDMKKGYRYILSKELENSRYAISA